MSKNNDTEPLPKERCILVIEGGQLVVGNKVRGPSRDVQWTAFNISPADSTDDDASLSDLEGSWFTFNKIDNLS